MADSGSRNDPFRSFNFVVNIQGMKAGFAEIGGLTTETDIVEYREGTDTPTNRKLPGKAKYTQLSFKRGYTNSKELWQWRQKVINGQTQRMSGTITLQDESRKAALTWKFYEGWPSKWAGPAFNAKNNDVAIEELEIAIEALELE